MKFLVVDDNEAGRGLIIMYLDDLGYTDVVQAEDGEKALAKFDSSFDFVITDWDMPMKTGVELAQALRDQGEQVPIIVVSGRSVNEEDLHSLRRAGVSDYVLKPIRCDVLQEMIGLHRRDRPASPQ